MSQMVIEFGSPTVHPVWEAMLSCLGQPNRIQMELQTGGIAYATDGEELTSLVYRKFNSGEIASVTLRTDVQEIRYGLILRPNYYGQQLALWMGTIELITDEWHPYWIRLLSSKELTFVCVGMEEGPELTDQDLTADSFPWNKWPLVIGALRETEGQHSKWLIRERNSSG